ncbi:MAG: 4Fe-4S dicluster domain-containing protein [Bacteroidales bacterium]
MLQTTLYQRLKNDVRLSEGLHACMNCGICTAVCPAAEYFEYDPRTIAITVQSGNEEQIASLLESETIWYCGQCMSCKPRCPRNNCPGLIISVLRKISQESGAFTRSRMGRQQYIIQKTVGENIFRFGYCVHPTTVVPELHPEQGPVWNWVYDNMNSVYATAGGNLDGENEGAMRKIEDQDLKEIDRIFRISGGLDLHQKVEEFSKQKAIELGMVHNNGEADMDHYMAYLLNDEKE